MLTSADSETTPRASFNDVWRFAGGTNTWYWMGGEKGPMYNSSDGSAPIPAQRPGPLTYAAAVYIYAQDTLFMHGGISHGLPFYFF